MKELEYLDSFANENPKNYQIWQHRRVIVYALGTGNFEKQFCEKIFEEDAKNYHAWAHRQWAVKTFNLWAKEIDFVNQCLEDDMRNNSAWNYRWFVVHEDPAGYTDESIAAEVDFVSSMIVSVSKNESAWNYLRGLANKHLSVVHKIVNWINEFMSQNSECAKNCFALGLLADLKENEGTQESVESSIELFKILIDVDPMRIKSWTRRVHLASAKLEIAAKV
jgi:protein farnesyltransferase/geranylgeranyltransferase type-1 subunit alpha